jgi:hypothetical protein
MTQSSPEGTSNGTATQAQPEGKKRRARGEGVAPEATRGITPEKQKKAQPFMDKWVALEIDKRKLQQQVDAIEEKQRDLAKSLYESVGHPFTVSLAKLNHERATVLERTQPGPDGEPKKVYMVRAVNMDGLISM